MSNTQNTLQDGIYKTWKTKQEVIDALRKVSKLFESEKGGKFYVNGRYYLAHGEYEAPDYIPCRYKDGWGIKEITYFYPGTFYARISGRRVMWVNTVDPDLPPEVYIQREEAW